MHRCIYLNMCACRVFCVGAFACTSLLKFVEMAACLWGSVCLARSSSMWAENREAAFWSHHSPDSEKSHRGKHGTVREMFAEGHEFTYSKSSQAAHTKGSHPLYITLLFYLICVVVNHFIRCRVFM